MNRALALVEPQRRSDRRPRLVLLHGWGVNSGVWGEFARLLDADFRVLPLELPGYGGGETDSIGNGSLGNDDPPRDAAALCEALLPTLPDRAIYVGWSLGGLVATYLASHYPERVSILVTIASSPCFVANETWRHGMPRALFQQFEARLRSDREKGLKYFARLQAHGDERQRQIVDQLQPFLANSTGEETLLAGLEVLNGSDLRQEARALRQPALSILGSEDKLVPASLAGMLGEQTTVWTVSGSGHIPFRSRPQAVAARIRDFCLSQLPSDLALRDKRSIARSFGGADDYDGAAQLQREAGRELMRRVESRDGGLAVDLGCGTACFTETLARVSGAETAVGLDLAFGMLDRARERTQDALWLCADAEHLPLADESVDVVFSNFSVQWCQQLHKLSSELYRCLKPGGRVYICTLGASTLWELRSAWAMVDDAAHVNRFEPMHRVRQYLQGSGLVVELCEAKHWTRRAGTAMQLARELRQIGAANVNPGRSSGLTGKALWRHLNEAYELLGDGQSTLPVTWEVGFLVAQKKE